MSDQQFSILHSWPDPSGNGWHHELQLRDNGLWHRHFIPNSTLQEDHSHRLHAEAEWIGEELSRMVESERRTSARIRDLGGAQGGRRDAEELAGDSGPARHPPSRSRAARGGPRRAEGKERSRAREVSSSRRGGG